MAITFSQASNSYITYGDINVADNATAFSIACTFRVASATATGDRIVSQWGNANAERAFLLNIVETNEVALAIGDGAGTTSHQQERTSSLNITTGAWYRVVATWYDNGGNSVTEIWVNGINQGLTNITNGDPPNVQAVGESLDIGFHLDVSRDPIPGEICEVAIYTEVVPQWFCHAYGKGWSPRYYLNNCSFYAPLWNSSHVDDIVGGFAASATQALVNADHPAMFSPEIFQMPHVEAVAGGATPKGVLGGRVLGGPMHGPFG